MNKELELLKSAIKAAQIMVARGKNKKLTDYRTLLTRWAEAYPIKLRPKLNIGKFTHDDPYWWKNINLKELDAYWRGEIAAAKLTNYLKPAIATLYLRGDLNHLVRQARLRKAKEGTTSESKFSDLFGLTQTITLKQFAL